jgi:hypothetical protein
MYPVEENGLVPGQVCNIFVDAPLPFNGTVLYLPVIQFNNKRGNCFMLFF